MTTVAQSTPEQAVNAWLLPRTKLEGISAIDHLWNRLSGTYGGRWLKDFPDMDSIENWKAAWAEAFDEDGLTPHDVAEGLRACRLMSPDWPPSVGEFIRLCRPWMAPEVAFYEAVAGMSARSRGEVGKWAHPAIYWAAVAVGTHNLLNCGYSVLKARWERSYAEELARGQWAAVPVPAPALPAPGATQATKAVVERELEAIGATGILNETGRDPRRGAKRILAESQRKGGQQYSPTVLAMAKAAMDAFPDAGAKA